MGLLLELLLALDVFETSFFFLRIVPLGASLDNQACLTVDHAVCLTACFNATKSVAVFTKLWAQEVGHGTVCLELLILLKFRDVVVFLGLNKSRWH